MIDDRELARVARQAALGAYAPYSRFRVGAAAVSENGTVFTAANVENAAYPSSQCAEANVIAYAVSQGARSFPVIAVACIDAESIDQAYPCGRCRQIMSEFDVGRVVVADSADEVATHTLDELLPHRFELDRPQ